MARYELNQFNVIWKKEGLRLITPEETDKIVRLMIEKFGYDTCLEFYKNGKS